MFISRVSLRNDTGAIGSLVSELARNSDRYGSHRLLWGLFGDTPDRKRDFVYRVDGEGSQARYTVVSAREPSDRTGLFDIETKPFNPDLRVSDRLAFSICANPTVKKRPPGGKTIEVDVVMNRLHKYREDGEEAPHRLEIAREEMGRWLEIQGGRHGFKPLETNIGAYRNERLPKAGGGKLGIVEAEGELEVTDPAAFLETLGVGLGGARAFGYGMLTVRRAA